jgi:hypothetical protein
MVRRSGETGREAEREAVRREGGRKGGGEERERERESEREGERARTRERLIHGISVYTLEELNAGNSCKGKVQPMAGKIHRSSHDIKHQK